MPKIMITGASGFVGQHLLEDPELNKYDVRVITRNPSKKMRILPAGVKVLQADLNNANSLIAAFSGIDVLVNTAAEVRNGEMLSITNIEGTRNLIQAIVANKIPKVIHLSSVGVVGMQYSTNKIAVDENCTCDPKNEYERTKLESERLLIEASKQYNFQLDVLRPTNVFGEHHPFNALLNLMQHIDAGKLMLNTKGAMVNYVYVKDLTAVIIKLMAESSAKGIVNVGNSCPLAVLTDSISEKLGKKKNRVTIPDFLVNFSESFGIKKLRSVSNKVVYTDERLLQFFNYPFDLDKGLSRTIDYYKQQHLLK